MKLWLLFLLSISCWSATYNVQTYGAVGDGSTNDTAAIQAAITAAVSSGALPAGIALSPDGVLSGTPTLRGAYSFGVKAANSIGSSQRTLTLQVVTCNCH